MSAEDNCSCLFCNCSTSDTVLYEINGNSVLISSQLLDLEEIIFDIFTRKIDSSVISYICDDCKEQLVQFYLFKENSKQNLQPSSFFDNCFKELQEFFSKNKDESNLELDLTSDNSFVVRIKSQYEADGYEPMEPMFVESDEEFIEESDEKYEHFAEEELPLEGSFTKESNFYEVDEKDRKLIAEVLVKDEENATDMKIIVDSIGVYGCDCGIQFSNAKDFQDHKSIFHKRRSNSSLLNLPFSCDSCGVMFKEEKYYKMHDKAHESFEAIIPQMTTFQCNECQILFSNEDDLMTHTSLHESRIENLEESLIERMSAFEGHFFRTDKPIEDDYMTDEILFTCGHCGIKKSEFFIKMHLLFFHTTVVYCPLDNRCFDGHKQIRQFAEHIKTKHPEIFDKKVEFICTCCNEKFATQFEKLAHMKVCSMKKYICEVHCGKRFKSEWLLNKHLKLVEVGGDKRFTCSLCPKQCVSKSDLQIHLRSHTNERPYECTICHKTFKTSANRSSHMDIHREEKIHECSVCSQKFQTRPILRKHMKKHDTEYQNQCVCQICKYKGYINRTHLLRHIKTSHSQPDLTIDQIDTFFQNYLMNKES